jgi:addiction module HigA family antidote
MAIPAIHPGEHLAEELKELGMSAAELARRLDVPTNRVTQILNRQRGITGDTALRLAHFFGTTAEFWLNLQSLYEIRLAEQASGKSIKSLPTLKRSNKSISEDLENRLRLLTAIARGEGAIQKGRTLTHGEAKQRLKRWLE